MVLEKNNVKGEGANAQFGFCTKKTNEKPCKQLQGFFIYFLPPTALTASGSKDYARLRQISAICVASRTLFLTLLFNKSSESSTYLNFFIKICTLLNFSVANVHFLSYLDFGWRLSITMSETLNLLRKVFVPEINEKLVWCLEHAYESSADYFAPQVGHDGMVFGLMVYKSNTHFLFELSHKEDWLEILSRSPKFLMQIDKYRLATYKVGDSLDIDPRFSFPNNRIGAYDLTKANLNQRYLFAEMNNEEHEVSDIHCTNLILAHAGNSDEGLLRVFLGIPSKIDERKQIVEWSTIFEIWSKDKDGEDFLSIPRSDEPKVPTEKVEPPTLKLKNKEKKRKADSGS